MKNYKRLLSLLLTAFIVLAAMPVVASADTQVLRVYNWGEYI